MVVAVFVLVAGPALNKAHVKDVAATLALLRIR